MEEADVFRRQLCELLSQAGMTLQKWRSNSGELRRLIPEPLLESQDLDVVTPHSVPKTLGIHWKVDTDTLHVSTPVSTNSEGIITKRVIASDTAKVFDVLGLFAPAIIPTRILLQGLWKLSLSWDDPVPPDVEMRWENWLEHLPTITNYSIPRRLSLNDHPVVFRALHGFADTSSVAYGVAIYLRQVHEGGDTTIALLTAKSRVLPLKPLTIPRAELVAAHLLARLMLRVSELLQIPLPHLFAWSDSEIVLHWLTKTPTSLDRFIANRISAIQSKLPASHWRHVGSKDNPADLASRGMLAKDLVDCELWWKGPSWLTGPPDQWPSKLLTPRFRPPDVAAPSLVTHVTPDKAANTRSRFLQSLWCKHSSLHFLSRVVAWILRFHRNTRTAVTDRRLSDIITSSEVQQTKTRLFQLSQQEQLEDVFDAIEHDRALPRGHVLSKPLLTKTDEGLLMVSSRVRDPSSPRDPTHLILLSPKSGLTQLLVQTLHQTYSHAGVSTLLSILGNTYFIPGLRNLVKKVSKSCSACQLAYARTINQQMGLLPSARTTPAPPFDRTGIDFAGPFHIKQGYTRKPVILKVYACVFVCLTTKAVHLDLCSSLSTVEFLATLRRFVARRGCPSHIFSDNGTNFIGARAEIRKRQEVLMSTPTRTAVANYADQHAIKWHHIPPRAPYFGGLWEAGVKAMKTLLRKLLAPHHLRFDELYTVLVEVESILNSRPLAPLHTDEVAEGSYLTPGHFLIGRPLKATPSKDPGHASITNLRRWTLVNRLTRDLWRRWLNSYLSSCAHRTKWRNRSRPINAGDIVYVKDDTLRYRDWPLAIITRTYPGDDGLVRAVDIRCRGKEYTRPLKMVIPFILADVDHNSHFEALENGPAPDHQEEKTPTSPSTKNKDPKRRYNLRPGGCSGRTPLLRTERD